MREAKEKKFEWAPVLAFLGLAAYIAVCVGGIYYLTGEIVQGSGFKAILWGSLTGLAAAGILFAATGPIVEKLGASPARKAQLKVLQCLIVLGLGSAFAFEFLVPVLRRNPAYYEYGGPGTQYEVTYASGKKEMVSGEVLGREKWGWTVALYFSIALVLCAMSSAALIKALLDLRNPEGSQTPQQ